MHELTTRQKAEEAKQRAEALLAELDVLEQHEREEQTSLRHPADFVTREGAAGGEGRGRTETRAAGRND